MSGADDGALQEFMLFTACTDPEVARRYLSVTRTMEDAVNLFFESGEEGGLTPARRNVVPAAGNSSDGGLTSEEEAYFAAQHRLEQLEREYNDKFGFSITRRISDLIFSRDQTPATEFLTAYPRFPIPLEKPQLKDLLKYLPFIVKLQPLAVCLAPPPQTTAQRELVERGPLSASETVALLGDKATTTAVLASNPQAQLLVACGVDLRKAPLVAVVHFDRQAQLALLGVVELSRPDFTQALRDTFTVFDAQQRVDERFVERLLRGEPPEATPVGNSNSLQEERRLREEQERAYHKMVEQHKKDAEVKQREQAEAQRRAAMVERQQVKQKELTRSFTEEQVPVGRAVTFLIRLPSGKKVTRVFDTQATFQRVHDFVLTVDDKGFTDPLAEFEIRAGFPPVRLALADSIGSHFPVAAEESIDVREVAHETQ